MKIASRFPYAIYLFISVYASLLLNWPFWSNKSITNAIYWTLKMTVDY